MTGNMHWRQWSVLFLAALGWVCSSQATGQNSKAPAPAAGGVKVTSYDTVSLNVQNTDLGQVLQLLSIQGRRNIVPTANVSGTVTANLYDVTFHEALDSILQQNGCGYREKGNFIYIYTLDELRKIEQAERKTVYRVFKLNYITAADASTFVTPLLSSAGSIAISGDPGPGFLPSVADGGANSYAHVDTMVVNDYPENIEAIKKVIAELDTRPKQVLVEATILKADLTEDMAFGVDFSIIGDIALSAFTNPLSLVNQLISGSVEPSSTTHAITSNVGNVSEGQAGVKVGIVTNNVAAFIRALDTVTDTTIIANPKILTLNRQRADVLVGEKIGYLSTTATATATTQTVEFLDTGTQLTLRPFVSDDGFIRLELKPQISSASIRNVIPGTETAAVTIPDEVTQEITTNIMIRDGQTVVLGGLFKEETSISRNQVPLLGDIPIAGAAFQGRDDNLTRTEVIFLITPHIIRDKALYAAGDAVMDSTEMMRIGARMGLLPWSRSKMTAAHLRDALEAIEEGNNSKALWEIDLALGLEPTQVEAIRLKEKLTGQRAYWPSQSMLEESIDLMVERVTDQRLPERSRPMVPDPRNTEPGADEEPLAPPPAKPQPKPSVPPFDEGQTKATEPTGVQAKATTTPATAQTVEAAQPVQASQPQPATPAPAAIAQPQPEIQPSQATFEIEPQPQAQQKIEQQQWDDPDVAQQEFDPQLQDATIQAKLGQQHAAPRTFTEDEAAVIELFGAAGSEFQDSIPPQQVTEGESPSLWVDPADTPTLESYSSDASEQPQPPTEPRSPHDQGNFAIREEDGPSVPWRLIRGMGFWFDGEDSVYPTPDATTNVPVDPADQP